MITSFIIRKIYGVEEGSHGDPDPTEPFFLIVADLDAGRFCVEGPMTDDQPWRHAAERARQTPQTAGLVREVTGRESFRAFAQRP